MEFARKLPDNKIICTVCPRNCILGKGQSGFCRVRKNTGEKINLETYGYTTGLAIDPIEKKPLYHFYPAMKVLSFGTFGCNMGCMFCQNYHMSKQNLDFSLCKKAMPEAIAQTAAAYGCKSVAFTYNDPVIFLEYAIDTAKECRNLGIKTVAVTAGYMNESARKYFYSYIDAVNIDLKGFTREFYAKNCLAAIEPIKDTIKYVAKETDCVLELTTLLIEGENDNENDLKREFDWILNETGSLTPIHLSAFHPAWKFSQRKPTSLSTLIKAYESAVSAGLKNVYTGNIYDEKSSTTFCPSCGSEIVKRHGYSTDNSGISENGTCKFCGEKIYGKY